MPSTISVLLTPRACCATAAVLSPITASSAAAPSHFVMPRSFRLVAPRPVARRSGLRVHGVDQLLVLHVDEGPAELHGRGQLLVLGGEELLDEAELLHRLHPGELLVHPGDLALDEVLHFFGPAQRGEVG